MILANVDHAGTVEAQVFAQAGKHLGGKLIFQLPAERKGDTVMADVDYNADTWSGQLKYGNNLQGRAGTSLGGTYLQSVTPRLALGGEGMCYLAEPSTQLTFAGRYATPNFAATAMLANGLPMPSGPGNAVIAYYHRKVSPGRVNLGAELTVFPKNLESTVAFGAEFNLKQSKLTTSVDGTGAIDAGRVRGIAGRPSWRTASQRCIVLSAAVTSCSAGTACSDRPRMPRRP